MTRYQAVPERYYDHPILAGLAAGRSFSQIASDIGYVSIDNVKYYAKDLYHRLGAHNQASAVCAAIELGLWTPRVQHDAIEFWQPPIVLAPSGQSGR